MSAYPSVRFSAGKKFLLFDIGLNFWTNFIDHVVDKIIQVSKLWSKTQKTPTQDRFCNFFFELFKIS